MKILVAADGSPFSKRMLAYLAAHDEWLGSSHQYTVLNCTPQMLPRAASFFDRESLEAYYRDEAEKVFKPIRTFFERHGIEAKFVAKVGHAAELIASTANKGKFDLLVMGSHGHGAIGNLVMGSVATKVLAGCKTPTLIVR
jgi:nucleotide-binding universal stress UspA family protein